MSTETKAGAHTPTKKSFHYRAVFSDGFVGERKSNNVYTCAWAALAPQAIDEDDVVVKTFISRGFSSSRLTAQRAASNAQRFLFDNGSKSADAWQAANPVEIVSVSQVEPAAEGGV